MTKLSNRQLFLTVAILLSAVYSGFFYECRADSQPRKIKVAYIDYGNFITKAADGSYNGYGAEYLAKIAEYTGWEYEYVDMDWNTAFQAVKEGKIDFYCVARQTGERHKDFDFSIYPICNEVMNLYMLPDSTSYYEDFKSFNGLRVGVLKNSSEIDYFKRYEKENNFSCQLVEFPMNEAALAALDRKEIDAAALVDYSVENKYKLVGNFGVSPAYLMSCSSSPNMLEFSRAQEHLFFDDPAFVTELENKYYPQRHTAITLSREEAEFIRNAPVITVAFSANMAPIEYYDESSETFKGITVDLFRYVSKLTGLKFKFVHCEDAPELIKAMELGKIQMVGALAHSKIVEKTLKLKQTKPVTESTFFLVSRNISDLSASSTVAVPAGYPMFVSVAERNGYKKCREYETFEKCVAAVYNKKADLTYIIGMCEDYILAHARFSDLNSMICAGSEYGICFGVSITADRHLFHIFNKTLATVTDHQLNEFIVRNTAAAKPRQTPADLLYRHGRIFVISLAFIVAFVIICLQKYRQKILINQKNREHFDFLQHLYDTIPCGIMQFAFEAPHVILNCNAAFLKIYGHDDNTPFIGKEPGSIVKEEDAAAFVEQFALCENSASSAAHRWVITRKDGSEVFLECTLEIVESNHGKIFQELIVDITERVRREQEAYKAQQLSIALAAAEKADAEKSRFLSRVSHELRTPLNAIIGFIELALGAEYAKAEEYLINSNIAAKQLLGVINDVLDMSSIEAGKIKIAKSPFNLSQMIISITNIYGIQCQKKGLSFEARVTTLTNEWLTGDELRMNQIFMNLLGNAVKFTSEGNICLKISQYTADNKKNMIRLEVIDSGLGMNDEMKDRLFKPFEQASTDTARKFGGSGLGLSIVKRLIELMNGNISVESQEGRGSRFVVDLPVNKCGNSANRKIPHKFENMQVLVLGTNKEACEHTCKLLTNIHVRSKSVYSCKDAMEELENQAKAGEPYNVCFVDLESSEMNLFDTIRAIREKYDETTLQIAAAVYDFCQETDRVIEAGAKLHISKPILQSTLFDLFQVLTGGRITRPENNRKDWDFGGKRVLLAEDNTFNQIIVQAYLNKCNVIVDLAVNGKIALDMFLKSKPGYYSAILMDIQMPEMDGYESTRQIRRSKHPDAASIPIIAQSGDAFESDVAKAMDVGMNCHIAKPIEVAVLTSTLYKAFTKEPPFT